APASGGYGEGETIDRNGRAQRPGRPEDAASAHAPRADAGRADGRVENQRGVADHDWKRAESARVRNLRVRRGRLEKSERYRDRARRARPIDGHREGATEIGEGCATRKRDVRERREARRHRIP